MLFTEREVKAKHVVWEASATRYTLIIVEMGSKVLILEERGRWVCEILRVTVPAPQKRYWKAVVEQLQHATGWSWSKKDAMNVANALFHTLFGVTPVSEVDFDE